MLADGEKVLVLGSMVTGCTVFSSTTAFFSNTVLVYYAVVIAGCAMASVSPNGGGVVPGNLGAVNLADEGTRWVRGWDPAARDALLAANKLAGSVDAAE